MFIPYMEMKGHTQFSLPNILAIEAEYNSPIQIIIGTNGSGKTTYLRECTPLPPLSTDFILGGYKRMVILDKGNRFFLESFFGKPVKHTFELNGENLNVSGKETEQRKLVRDYFGITPQLHKLMTGEIRFSKLSAHARRDWLMSISGMNFEYAMQLFQRARDYNREANTLVKSMAGRSADEIEKLSQIGDTTLLKERSKELSNVIGKLMRLQGNTKPRKETEIRNTVQTKLSKIDKLSREIVSDLPRELVYRFEHIPTLDDLKVHTQALVQQGQGYRDSLNELYRKKGDLVKLTERARDEGVSLEGEREIIYHLTIEADTLEREVEHYLFLDKEVHYTSIDEFEPKIRMAVEGYVTNTDLKYSSNYWSELQSDNKVIAQRILDTDKQINGLEHDKKHHSNAPDADCPDCGLHFKIGNAVKEIESIDQRLSDLDDLKVKYQLELDKSNALICEFQEFVNARKSILTLLEANDSKIISKLKEEILAVEVNGVGSNGLQEVIWIWREAVDRSRRILTLRQEASERTFALKHYEEIEELRRHYEGTQLDDIDVEIDRMMRAITQATDDYKASNELAKVSENILAKLTNAMELHRSLDQDLTAFSFMHEQQLIEETLLGLQTELAGINTTISKVDSIQHTIDNLSKYCHEAEVDQQASAKLIEYLSPNSGLIAEHILGFLEDFVEELNRFIQTVWEYDMEILPCRLDSEDLDYRFPVRMENDLKLRKDIALTSKGQCEVIDLVICLAIMSSVDKTVLPLYLDEPADGFDEKHTENFVRFIKSYLEHGDTEQIFMISHNFVGHASFTNAETMVLDDANVLNKPPRYNNHVKFLYN